MPKAAVGGLLLTGGASRRMGFDKAMLVVNGLPISVHLAQALLRVSDPVLEVGPGRSGLPAVIEDAPGSGPLAAVAAGGKALQMAEDTAAIVLACDLPGVNDTLLRMLADWPGELSVVPVVAGREQPLCARWSAAHLRAAAGLVGSGERSMRALMRLPGVVFADETLWPAGIGADMFSDVDVPADLGLLPPLT